MALRDAVWASWVDFADSDGQYGVRGVCSSQVVYMCSQEGSVGFQVVSMGSQRGCSVLR